MPNHKAQKLFQEGCAHHDAGRDAQALACFNRAVQMQPDFAPAHLNQGVSLQRLGRWQESVMSLSQALALDPGSSAPWNALGVAMRQLRQPAEAAQCFEKAVSLAPDFAVAHTNLGAVLRELHRLDEAVDSHRKALALQSQSSQAWNNLALALRDLGRLDEAMDCFRQSISLHPHAASVWSNLGVTLGMAGRLEEAAQCHEEAVALQPGDPDLQWNRAQGLLALGRFSEGWPAFESRWQSVFTGMRLPFPRERQWRGQVPLEGLTLLVHHEQGLGDSLQFCRYVQRLTAAGAKVIVQVPRPLRRLLEGSMGVSHIIDRGDPTPQYDWHCPMMSLPGCFETDLAGLSSCVPYLRAAPSESKAWAERLGPAVRPRVGLVWSGGLRPDQPELRATNERRNISFRQLARIQRPDVDFFSLQKGDAAIEEMLRERPTCWSVDNLHDFTSQLDDFADTAALIDNLDLVVTVDTSTAHLAGAMGKPVWILNRFDMCWRWRLDPLRSAWYPTARLFNQSTPGDWQGLLDRLTDALGVWVNERSDRPDEKYAK
jgi:Flp pilus assembly protein TadD